MALKEILLNDGDNTSENLSSKLNFKPINPPVIIKVIGTEEDLDFSDNLRKAIEDYASLHCRGANAFCRGDFGITARSIPFKYIKPIHGKREIDVRAYAVQFYRIEG